MKIKKSRIKFFVGDFFFIFEKNDFKNFCKFLKLNMNVKMNYSFKN